jgi:hypothetical protein
MGRGFAERMGGRCAKRWGDLTPRDGGRFCADCQTVVIDLSRLTRREARARVRGGACGRVRLDLDGEPTFRTEPLPRLAAGAIAAIAAVATACAVDPAPDGAPAEPPPLASAPLPLAASLEPTEPLDGSVPPGVALDELDPRRVASLDEAIGEMRRGAEPTEEQRELTARKRRLARFGHGSGAHPATAQPPLVEYMGFMDTDF